jgi:hypothetical protein
MNIPTLKIASISISVMAFASIAIGMFVISYSKWGVILLGLMCIMALTVFAARRILGSSFDSDVRQRLLRIFYIGMGIRIVSAIALYFALISFTWKGRPGIFFDDEAFHTTLPLIRNLTSWLDVWEHSIEKGPHVLYLIFTNSTFFLFDDSNLTIRLFSAVLASLLIPMTARIALEVTSEKNKTRFPIITAWLTALSPELILFSVSVLREWMIASVLILACFAAIKMSIKKHTLYVVSLGVSIAALTILRIPATILLLVVFIVWALFETVRRNGRPRPVFFGMALVLVPFMLILTLAKQLSIVPYSPFEIGGWAYLVNQRYIIDTGVTHRVSEAFAHSGSFLETSATYLGADPIGWFLAALKRFVSPSPLWFPAVRDFHTFVFFLPGLFWYGIVPPLIIGTIYLFKSMSTSRLLLLLVGGIFFGVTLSPLGLGLEPLRARIQILPFLYIIAAYGILVLKDRESLRRDVLLIVSILYLAMAMFYYLGLLLPWPVFHPYSLAFMVFGGLFIMAIVEAKSRKISQFLNLR